MQPDDENISADEEWYYEIGGRSHGPMSWTALEELLSHSAETAAEVRVRKGPDGEWVPFRSGSSPTARQRIELGPASVSEISRTDTPRPHRLAPRVSGGGLRALVRGRMDIIAAVGAWLLLNVLFVLFWPQPYARERRYLATLRKIETELQELRAKPASEGEWHEFRERTQAELAPIVRDLEKSANSSELVRQQLLWSVRDLLPKTLGLRTKERDAREKQLKEYLDSVERALAGS